MAANPDRLAQAAPHDEVNEFPDWLDPMVVKELRQGLRASWFLGPFIGIQMACLGLIWIEYRAANGGAALASEEIGHQFFWGLVFLTLGGVLPLRSLTGLSGDLAGDGTRLVLLAGISRWRIVMGKWLTQMMLAGLTAISLMPYAIVRYFFGGVEFLPNLLTLGCALGVAAAMNALLLGASGYADYWMRTLIALAGALYVGVPMVALAAMVGDVSTADELFRPGLASLAVLWGVLGVGLALTYYCLCGLQLARARLRAGTRPWEVPPSRPVLVLFFLSPLYFGLISFATCGLGFPLVAAGLVWWVWSLDPADFPVRSEMHFIHPQPTVVPKTYRF